MINIILHVGDIQHLTVTPLILIPKKISLTKPSHPDIERSTTIDIRFHSKIGLINSGPFQYFMLIHYFRMALAKIDQCFIYPNPYFH